MADGFDNITKVIIVERKVFVIYRLIALTLVIMVMFTSCSNKEKDTFAEEDLEPVTTSTPAPTPTPKPTETPEPTPDLTGMAVNPLTGEYIKEETAQRRPVAMVINNLKKALPQSGISQADLYYEVLAEGDITRIIAVFKDFDSEKIGPIRSARHYFLDFAFDNDAVFIHHGGSPQAYSSLQSLKVNNIDAMRGVGSGAFWRDKTRLNQSGMYEHSSYTDAAGIIDAFESSSYRKEVDSDEGLFNFFDEFSTPLDGEFCMKFTVPFSQNYQATFEYDAKNNIYKKYQGSGKNPHIDEETGKQLSVTNVIVQFTSMHVIAGDDAGRRDVKTVSSGKGYMFTGGEYFDITWKKDSHTSPAQYFDEKGKKLTVNKGKTWICVFQDGAEIVFE